MSERLFDLTSRCALVTGSSRGLGFVIARGLGRAGASVILNGRDEKKVNAAVRQLTDEGLDARGVAFDITDSEQVARGVSQTEEQSGHIDILVNNAGINLRGPLLETSEETWRKVLDVNLTGAFLVGREVARGMIERKCGKIINICSLMSEITRATIAPYTAAKGGLRMLTRSMAVEWGPYNIQTNGIGPGFFLTEMTRPLHEDAEFDAWLIKRTPTGRWGKVEELVGPAVFLGSEASDFVNGQVLYVDGGILAAL